MTPSSISIFALEKRSQAYPSAFGQGASYLEQFATKIGDLSSVCGFNYWRFVAMAVLQKSVLHESRSAQTIKEPTVLKGWQMASISSESPRLLLMMADCQP